jgi:amino acid adenylation domain-containing protein
VDELRKAPLSSAQEGLWFLQQLEPNSSVYNNVLLLRFQGSLDVALLGRSINEVVRRHEALRIRFAVVDGMPIQLAAPEVMLKLPVTEVTSREDGDGFGEALRQAAEEAGRPFDLADDRPPIRARLFRMGNEDHLLLIVVHHIICDGEGITTLARDLVAVYGADGKASELATPAAQYIDVINKRHRELTQERLTQGIEWWKRQLAGAPPLVELPLDRPRPAVQSSRGRLHRIALTHETVNEVREFARLERVTFYMTILAALQILLYRYSGQEDILVGTPMTGRNRIELRSMVGYLVNTIVLRTKLRPDLTVRDLLKDVRGTAIAAFGHSYVPFERVVQALRPPRARSHHPVFNVLLSFHERGEALRESDFQVSGARVSFPHIDTGGSRFDLSLCVHDEVDSLGIDFEYSSDLFDHSTIERMAQHFQMILSGMVRTPDAPITAFPLLADTEYELLVHEWGGTVRVENEEFCLHQLIERQAARTPSAVAVIWGHQRLTYGELDRRANQLAHCLRRLGVGPEQFVGICLEHSLDMVVGLLGILKAGAGYVFIEPNTPLERCEFMLRDTNARVIVTQERLLATSVADMGSRVNLDRNLEKLAREPAYKPAERARGEDLAYCIYTSGSTGSPKAVGIRHSSCVWFLRWAATAFSADDLAGVLASSSPMFDCALFELWMPLAWGGTAILADSLLSLPELQSTMPITLMMAAPTVIAQLMQSKGLPASVRAINLSGEAVPKGLPEVLYHSTSAEKIFNFYGISEITTHATGTLLQRRSPDDSTSEAGVPVIGRPIDGATAYILDAHMNPVPIGLTGELYIGGAGVARGYLTRPALTAERFLPDPFSPLPGSRMYRSGDLVRWRASGDIEFLGRGDHQVKLRGFRIELGAVESSLAACPGVRDATVLLHEDEAGHKQLVGYVVAEEGSKLPISALRAFLRERIPEQEVPAAFTMLDSMPLMPNGKVDRASLPPPDPEVREVDEGVWRMADAVETQIELIWNDLLDRHEIRSWDNFFDLGGDSLLALVMLTRVQETFGGIRIPVGRFMAAPTIEELSTAVREQGWAMPPSCLVKVTGSGEQRPFFCVHPGGGELYELRYLRQELGERPVYALMPIGWNGEAEPLASIEEMAAQYIREIRHAQPHGSYLLGGYSLGGVIAYEIAQQLVAMGEQVSFLGLFESWPVVDVVCLPEDAYEYGSTVAAVELFKQTGRVAMPAQELLYLKSMSHAIPGLEEIERDLKTRQVYDFEGLCKELEDMRPRLQVSLEQLKERGLAVKEMDIEEFYRIHEVAAKQIWALSAYRPKPYPYAATLFAGRTAEGVRVLERVWKALVGELRVEFTASEEHSIFFRDPSLAEALRRSLEEAEKVIPASVRGAGDIQ